MSNKTQHSLFNTHANYYVTLNKYNQSLQAGEVRLDCSQSFDKYVNERKTKLEQLPEFKTPSGNLVSEQLSKATGDAVDKANALKKAFTEALQLEEATASTQKDYNANLEAVARLFQKKPAPDAVAGYLGDLRAQAETSIEAQHKKEKAAITALFETPEFQANLSAIGITEANRETFKNDTLTALENSHKEEKKKLDDSIKNDIDIMHLNTEREIHRIAYLHYLSGKRGGDKLIREALAKKGEIDEEEMAASGATNHFDPETGIAMLKGLELSELGKFKAIDKDIHVQDGTFVLKLSKWNNFTFGTNLADIDDANLAELTALAKAVRASKTLDGKPCNSITTTISYQGDEKRAIVLCQQAYEAAVNAGFSDKEWTDPKNKEAKLSFINIYMGDKKMSPEEIFKNNPPKLAELRKKAKDLSEQRKNLTAFYLSNRTKKIDNYKAQVAANRQEHENQNAEAPNPDLEGPTP